MNRNRAGVAYLQVRPHPNYAGELRAVKVTQKPPEVVEPGCIVIKLGLLVPVEAFLPLEPEVDVVVPVEKVQRPVAVEVDDATDGGL